jgi:hypothetical protein
MVKTNLPIPVMTNQHGQKTAVQKFLTKYCLVSKRQTKKPVNSTGFFVVNSSLFYQLYGTVGSNRNGAIARLEVLVSDFSTGGF